MKASSPITSTQDPFLFDREEIEALAAPDVLRAGLKYFRDNRVAKLETVGETLRASVEDEDSEEQLSLILEYDEDGNLVCDCDCGQPLTAPCVHTVAALFAYGARTDSAVALKGAAETAIDERTKRGRAEVVVEHVSGELWFGTWRAHSLTSTSHFPASYQVHIRSLERRSNYCTCPDFATNQLGTCKHVEAVLHQVRKRRDYFQIKDLPPSSAYVYLDWEAEAAPRIRLHRPPAVDPETAELLDAEFDAAGAFRHGLPDDFLRFAERAAERKDLDLGADALDHARHLAAQAAQRARVREIGDRIRAEGGRLPGIAAKLYPYQVEGVAFLTGNGRALLADDMGLGKTLQGISAAVWLCEHAEAERILIVCPASLKQQWAREIHKFSGHDAQIVQGAAAARAAQYRRGVAFFIINYELVLRDLSVINETLRPDLLILDEAQRIKNWRIKLAAAVKRIPTRYAFVLSGTPLENRLEDLYSLMQVVDPRVLGPLWRYLVDFHVTDERGKVLGYRNLSELRRRLAPVMLRRDRSLVSDQLPERIEQRLDIGLTPKQQELHDVGVSTAAKIALISRTRPLTPAEQNRMMAALQSARMACDAAGLVDKETQGSPKLDELANLLDELCIQNGLKAVVFSQWAMMTEMVEQRLQSMGLGYVRLHGGVPTAKRGELMDRFRDDDAIQVFVSTDAGGTGLNLQNASVLINLDVPWNPAVLDQRIARVHRLGQTERVQAILLVAADSYEEHVLSLVQGKRNLFDNVVQPEATEDVVGISKRLAEVIADDLAPKEPEPGEPAQEQEGVVETLTEVEEAAAPGSPGGRAEVPDSIGPEVRRCILELQRAFGPRIERILGSGGGLLVILDQVDVEADRTAASISEQVPIAVIDPRTLNSLRRLGASSPVADAAPLYEPEIGADKAREPQLLRQARQKLDGAEVLMRQSCLEPALDLLLAALLGAAAVRAGQDKAPSPQQAGIWLYQDALPKGALSAEEASLIMRAVALAQAADQVPEPLLRQLTEDTAGFVDATTPDVV